MSSKNVNLTGHYTQFIDKEINEGYYNNASEVIRAGLHLLERQKLQEQAKLKALEEAARIGFKDIDDGNYIQINNEKELKSFFSKIEDEADQQNQEFPR